MMRFIMKNEIWFRVVGINYTTDEKEFYHLNCNVLRRILSLY